MNSILLEIKELIFGENRYKRTRIDERFLKLYNILNKEKLFISNEEELEILEKIIFKIEEQLRVKSSNLNRVINDNSYSLNINLVNWILEKLKEIKKERIKILFKIEREYLCKNENETIINTNENLKDSKTDYAIADEKVDIKTNYEKEENLEKMIKLEEEKDNLEKKFDFIDKKEEIKKDDEKVNILKDEPVVVETKRDEKKEENIVVDEKFLIYKDNKISVFLNENSKIFGELILRFNDKNFLESKDEILIYASIFSKIFSSLVFEGVHAEGTNIILNSESNEIRIIPRFISDNINELKINNKEGNPIELKEIKDELLNVLLTFSPNKEKVFSEKKEVSKKEIENDNKNIEINTENKKKVEKIIEELKRIP